ncbi:MULTISPECIES: DUF397 domain-containing protein [unclassified Streptomyces]|uniref:DUF397 domain-containing protein n=1 Tax=unclassified Streptomyces TaxID=2593676 RepID=UPI00081B5F7F|nr:MULTISPECIES: DUF397 domain-containing protein [unclassified Streptomyces]MEE1749165.1 DUF397 domain-containing protein [Streptomyces sp. JV184]MYQ89107.1 DUF397 domain-containing protein [Streptomyces sp. SID4936]SCE57589.1 protein of unknown function [Streptomyces sp. DvalAA-43]
MNTSPTVDNASDLHVSWWKSSASGAQSDCVECGVIDTESVAVRDSKVPNGPALIFGRDALSAMVDAVAGGLV